MKNSNPNKKEILGQYFTKIEAVEKVMHLMSSYMEYNKDIDILEPSFGTGNFISVLKKDGFHNITGCEIDSDLTDTPSDFFNLPLSQKFDLIIGNPPFSKYNVKASYYHITNHLQDAVSPSCYIKESLVQKSKLQIETTFILKSIKHLSNRHSSIAFVLPISFFIKNKHRIVKNEISKRFSTIIIYQNDKKWFDEPVPCCFAIFTNLDNLRNKIVLLFDDGQSVREIIDKSEIFNELIPCSFLYRKNTHQKGVPLSEFLEPHRVSYLKSFEKNNVSASNILTRTSVPDGNPVSEYLLAVVRVGNGSVGKSGLINIKDDVLNDMFYVFRFKPKFNNDTSVKERVCASINGDRDYLLNSSFRVGSKSIKKSDILEFKVEL